MKIALIGTHGTGKTTLLFSIAAELKKLGIDVGIVNEAARKCPLPINRNCTFESQLWIMTAQITEELETLQNYAHVFCDRSVLDAYVYSIVTKCEHPLLEKIADTWIKTYDYLFKLPVLYKLHADKLRNTDKKFQQA
ncbi:ATP-binding protein, partial [Candidatus Woesearchaeota archaeon]|nr:ATP-binding protein [Candidatus Woesearchaeota archaeon]